MLKKIALHVAALAVAMAATATYASDTRTFNIPAGDLAPALESLAKETGLELIFQPAELKGIRTQGVSGTLSPQDAVARLITGTRLTIRTDSAGAILIAPSQATSKTAGSADIAEIQPTAATNLRVAQATDNSQKTDNSPSETSSEVSEDKSRIQEIVVTAQKSLQNLKDVPVSIGVLSGEKLDVTRDRDIFTTLTRVPGVFASRDASYNGGGRVARLTIRGARSGGFNSVANTVGYYVDGVPFGGPRLGLSPSVGSYDLERIEILRGPQGTLYGVNAMVGVVRLISKGVDYSNFELKSQVEGSRTDHGGADYGADAAVNIPLVEDKLALRVTGGYHTLSGYISVPNKEDYNDESSSDVRVKLGAKPTDYWTATATAWLAHASGDGLAQSEPAGGVGPVTFFNPFKNRVTEEPSKSDFRIFSLENEFDLGFGTLTSVTGANNYTSSAYYAFDAIEPNPTTGATYNYRSPRKAKTFSQELYLSSPSEGPWRYSFGGMYYRVRGDLNLGFNRGTSPTFIFNTFMRDESSSYAFFGQLTRMLFDDRLELTGGLRHFRDNLDYLADLGPLAAPGSAPVETSAKFNATTPRFVATWHVNKELMFYASYSQGFRSGQTQEGLTIATVPGVQPVDPDRLTSYEIGSKGSTLSGMLDWDFALYHQVWKDRQELRVATVGAIATNVLLNAEKAEGTGLETSLTFHPTRGLNVGVNFAYNGLENTKDVFTPDGSRQVIEKGTPVAGAPIYTAGAFLDYDFPIFNDNRGNLSFNYHWEDSRIDEIVAAVGKPNYGRRGVLHDLTASFTLSMMRGLDATVFATNILNNQPETIAPATFPEFSRLSATVRPRMIGLRLGYRFQ